MDCSCICQDWSWNVPGLFLDCSWIVLGCFWIVPEIFLNCSLIALGLFLDCSWIVLGLSSDFPWIPSGMFLKCSWIVSGLFLDCSLIVLGLLLDSSWLVPGLFLGCSWMNALGLFLDHVFVHLFECSCIFLDRSWIVLECFSIVLDWVFALFLDVPGCLLHSRSLNRLRNHMCFPVRS